MPVPAECERPLTAGASVYILRGGQPLRLTLTVRGDALGAAWTKPQKSQFYEIKQKALAKFTCVVSPRAKAMTTTTT